MWVKFHSCLFIPPIGKKARKKTQACPQPLSFEILGALLLQSEQRQKRRFTSAIFSAFQWHNSVIEISSINPERNALSQIVNFLIHRSKSILRIVLIAYRERKFSYETQQSCYILIKIDNHQLIYLSVMRIFLETCDI